MGLPLPVRPQRPRAHPHGSGRPCGMGRAVPAALARSGPRGGRCARRVGCARTGHRDPRAPSRRRGAGDNDMPADTCGAQVLRGLHYPHESEVRPTRRWGNLRGLTIGLPSVHKGTVLNDLGVSSRSPSADADLTGRSLIAASCAWVPGTQVGDRPTGRTNLLHRFVPGLPVSRGHGLLPRLLADKPAPRC
jgi:hypothetical protein